MQVSERALAIDPFYVMECAKAAADLAAQGAPMIFLNIGEPDFTAAPRVVAAAQDALRAGSTQYTPALGIPALREALSQWYSQRWGLDIASERIIITAGASAALQLACLALINPGDKILMPDPSYPCNRHFVTAALGQAQLIPCTPDQRYQLQADQVAAHWDAHTRGVLLASPSNPTGTSIAPEVMQALVQEVQQRKGFALVDEIYLPLSFDDRFGQSVLRLDADFGDHVISINSFSKYFNMTGWRLGWMVVPAMLVPVIERLAQNLFICPSTVAQHAALACFHPESLQLFEARRLAFKERRDYFVPALNALGLKVPVTPDGAFYAYADCSAFSDNSWDFAFAVMQQAHLAITPGRDFGVSDPQRYVRFSTANSMAHLQEAIARLQKMLA